MEQVGGWQAVNLDVCSSNNASKHLLWRVPFYFPSDPLWLHGNDYLSEREAFMFLVGLILPVVSEQYR